MKSLVRAGLLAALALIVAMIGGAKAADEPVNIRLVPEAISLQPGLLNQDIVLIAQLPAKATVVAATLSWVNSPGLDIKRLAEPKSPATADLVWKLSIAALPSVAKDTVVAFVLEYQLKTEETAPVRSAAVTATVRVSYSGLSLAKSIAVTVEHGFDTLTPGVPRAAFLVIENTGAEDVRLDSIDTQPESYLLVGPCFKDKDGKLPPCTALPTTVPGRSTKRVQVQVEATPSIPAAGALHVLLNLGFSRGTAAAQETATIGVRDTVQAGIPGVSEIKTVLQIPSLLFLPGVLVVLTMGLIWKLAQRAPAFPLPANEGHFYVVSISLSLLIAWIYSRYVLKEKYGLLEALSLADVATIWFSSIVVGLVLYAIMAAIKPTTVRVTRWFSDNINPKTGDNPEAILRKIAWNERLRLWNYKRPRLQLQTFSIGKAAKQQRVFELGFAAPDAQHIWGVPKILLTLNDGGAESERRVRALLGAGDLAGLRRFLKEKAGHYDIAWEPPFDEGPTSIARSELSEPLGRQGVVDLQ